MAILSTAVYTDNEIAKAVDFNYTGESAFGNLALVFYNLFGPSAKKMIVQGMGVQQRTVPSMNIDVAIGLGYDNVLQEFMYNGDLAGPVPFEASDLTNDRIDIVEMRQDIVTYDIQQRAFKDPVSGSITYQNVATKEKYVTEFQVKKGTAAANPVAPSVDTGWVKIAEVYIRANTSTILDTDIRNCTAYKSGDVTRAWTTDRDATFILQDLSAIKTQIAQISQTVNDNQVAEVSGMSKLLVYYGYPSVINNSYSSDLSMARAWLALYDVLVLAYFGPVPDDDPRYSDPNWYAGYLLEQANVIQLIEYYKSDRPDGLVFMYTPIGRNGFTWNWREFTDAEIKTRLNWIGKTAGCHGVFVDEAGWDYGVSRTLQNNVKLWAKQQGLRCFWNSWRPDDTLNTYIVQREWQSTGVLTHYLYSSFTAGANEIEVWVHGTQYTLYTGAGDPPAGYFKEDTSGGTFKIIVNKAISSYVDPWTEIRNKRGNTGGVGGNMTGIASAADSDDWYLHESLVSTGDYTVLDGDGFTVQRYGWEMHKWLYSKSDRAFACRQLTGCKLAAVTRCDFANMFRNNDPGIMDPTYWDYKWPSIKDEPLIDNMLGAAYAWALLYGYDSWGFNDGNFSASSAKTFPYENPKINLKALGRTTGDVQHLDGPITMGAYKFQAVHSRSFQGGKLFCIYDARPTAYVQPLKFYVKNSSSPTEEYVGNDIGINAKFHDGLGRGDVVKTHEENVMDGSIELLSNFTTHGLPTFLRLTGDHRIDHLLDDDAYSALCELATGDGVDNKGVAPGTQNGIFEPSALGLIENPNVFSYLGKSSVMCGAVVNLAGDPLNMVTGWSGANASRSASTELVEDFQMSKIKFTINNGTWGYSPSFAAGADAVVHGVSCVLRRGNDTKAWIELTDSTAAAVRLKIRAEFDTRRVVAETGVLAFATWLDDDTVVIRAITTAITKANTHYFNIVGNLGSATSEYYVYAALPMIAQDQGYPVPFPYAGTTRGAMKSSLYYQMPTKLSIKVNAKAWFHYDNTDEHTIFNWMASSSSYLKLMYETYDATVKVLRFQWGGYVPAVAGDIGKTVVGATTGATGTLLDYDNTNRYWRVQVTSGTFSVSEAISITAGTGAGTTTGPAITGLQFTLKWKNGGSERTIKSSIFDDGTNFTSINRALEFVISLDLTTGTTAGVELYINKILQNSAWSGAADTIGSSVLPWAHIGWNGTNGYWGGEITSFDAYSGTCTQDDVNDGMVHKANILTHKPEAHAAADKAPSKRSVVGFWEAATNISDGDPSSAAWTKSSVTVTDIGVTVMNEEMYRVVPSAAWAYCSFPFAVTGAAKVHCLDVILDLSEAANHQITLLDGAYANQLALSITTATKSVVASVGTLVRADWLTDKVVRIQALSASLPVATGYQVVFTAPAATDIFKLGRVMLSAYSTVRPFCIGTRAAGGMTRHVTLNPAEGYIEFDVKAITNEFGSSDRVVLTDMVAAASYGVDIALNGTTLTAILRNTAGTTYTLTGTLSLDAQHHVKIFWSVANTLAGLYIDDVLTTSAIAAVNMAFTDTLQVGWNNLYAGGRKSLDGYVAQIRMTNAYDNGNLHAQLARPYYTRNRLIGVKGNMKWDSEGTAFFNNMVLAGDLQLRRKLRFTNPESAIDNVGSVKFSGYANKQSEPFLGYARYKS